MTLSNYLRGIPPKDIPNAANAAAKSIHEQHHRLLRSAAEDGQSPKHLADLYSEIEELVTDAKALLELNILVGHSILMAKRVATLDLKSVMASLRFQARNKNEDPNKPAKIY